MQKQRNSIIFSGKGFSSRIPFHEPLAVKAVLFDLDNTLLDYMYFKEETAKAAAKAMVDRGFPANERKVYELIFAVYSEKGIEYNKTFSDVIKPFNLEVNRAERIQQAGLAAYAKRKHEVLRPYPEVPETLTNVKLIAKTGVVSDAPRNKAWQRLVMSGLEDYFDIVVTHTDTREFKPHPSPFRLALERLGLEGKDCLFVGDNPDRDIKGAKAAGMYTAWAKYGAFIRSGSKADFELDSVSAILEIIRRPSL